LSGLSAKVANLVATGTTASQYGTVTLTGTMAHHMEVFNVRGSDLCNANYINIQNIDSYATIFVNVMGDNLNCGRCGFSNYNPQNVLFNFYQAHTLTFQSVSWMGSVLAPYADISNPTGNLLGQVFANSWTSTGSTCMQQNWYPFQGCITSCYWHRTDALCTYSADAWGQDTCSTGSSCPAYTALNADFDSCLPVGLVVGCGQKELKLTTTAAVRAFLPQNTTSYGVLDGQYRDATSTSAGAFAAELVSLGLSLGIDSCDPNFAPACGNLKDIYVCNLNSPSCSAFNGKTIGEVYEIANQIIGQCPVSGITLDNAYNCVQFINSQFSGCQPWTTTTGNNFGFCSCGTSTCGNTPDYVIAELAAQSSPNYSSAVWKTPALFLLGALTLFLM